MKIFILCLVFFIIYYSLNNYDNFTNNEYNIRLLAQTSSSPTQTSPTQASTTHASTTQTSPTQTSPTQTSPTQASTTQASITQTSPTQTSPTQTSPNKASPYQVVVIDAEQNRDIQTQTREQTNTPAKMFSTGDSNVED